MGWTFGGTDTCFTVSGWFVGQWELSEISADHVEFDLDWVESFTVVDSDKVSDHFGHDDTVSEMGFYEGRFLTGGCVLFGFFTFHVESVISMFNFSGESSSLSGSEEFNNLLSGEFVDLFRSQTLESVFLKSFLFLLNCSHQIINIIMVINK